MPRSWRGSRPAARSGSPLCNATTHFAPGRPPSGTGTRLAPAAGSRGPAGDSPPRRTDAEDLVNLTQIVMGGNLVADADCTALPDGRNRTRLRLAANSRELDPTTG